MAGLQAFELNDAGKLKLFKNLTSRDFVRVVLSAVKIGYIFYI